MKFEEVLPALKEGKKIRRKSWPPEEYMRLREKVLNQKDAFTCDDWEIVKEKKKVKLRDLTEEQCKNWEKSNCSALPCDKCIFNNVRCRLLHDNYWFKHKELYSDKFLDQEIEIDE